ncbi:MAG: TlyA family RNA methyltransferase [Beijerinckiaceae bacterium]|nr:TlyA family RNA methyltransferase [Beijerinckiaceae bacterium]
MSQRQRIDQLLVSTGRFDSRARARAAIEAGLVRVGGRVVKKASEVIAQDAPIEAQAPHPWVSRAGLKLVAGLDAFGVDPAGATCLDVGSSTGGFTQVLLARGAAKVYAVDVGRDQLHPSLRADPRVISMEGCDARTLAPAMFDSAPQIIVCDASFISLRLILPKVLPLACAGARLVALVKPQFEAGRENVGKGGIVRDADIHARVCAEIAALVRELGWRVDGLRPSPIEGGDGNCEFLIGATQSAEMRS